jgi:hypothetical protein
MTDERELTRCFEAVLAHDEGKRVLFWVLEQAGVYREGFAGDDAATNYTLGQQSIGRKLIGRLDAIDNRLYPKLLLAIADLAEMDRRAVQPEENDDAEE